MNEIETKILDVDSGVVKNKLLSLGAENIQELRLVVDWYGPQGLTHKGDDPYFLRIRNTKNGNFEVTWKGNRNFQGVSSSHKEINFEIKEKEAMESLFLSIGLENYAHQEKDRTSFLLKDWRFDLDQYPNMPAYLEVEGKSEEHIQEAIKLLGLSEKTATPEGERKIISEIYGLDWYNMRF